MNILGGQESTPPESQENLKNYSKFKITITFGQIFQGQLSNFGAFVIFDTF